MEFLSAAPPPRMEPTGDVRRWTFQRANAAVRTAVWGLATSAVDVGAAAGGFAADAVFDVGAAAPFVGPVFVALKRAKDMVGEMEQRREELADLHDQCTLITTRIIVRCNHYSNHDVDVKPLKACVDDIYDFAKVYNGQGKFKRMFKMKSDHGKIVKLKGRIDGLLVITAAEGYVRTAEGIEGVRSEMALGFAELHREIASRPYAHTAPYASTHVSIRKPLS